MPMVNFKRCLRRRLPILEWGATYTKEKLLCDGIAGITVALTVMPQGLAYATLAGLEPQYGLYSAFVGCFVYAIFGSCKDITIGPTALMALMTYQQIADRNTDYAILLCFLSGIVQLIMALLNLGVLIDFISIPVTVGFTSATSVIIATSQLKSLLGLKFTASGFLDTIRKVFENISSYRVSDTILGIVCIVSLIILRKLKDLQLPKRAAQNKFLSHTLWLISTSRNALIVLLCSSIAYAYTTEDSTPFLLTGDVKGGMPTIQPPPFSTVLNNQTMHFTDMVSDLGMSVLMVPIIAVLGNVAIAKAFASGHGVDATQELLTLSMCNVFGSFFSSMPITGSFSRSAVNHASGVQTPFGGVFTGVTVLLALTFLTPYFAFIPKASLGAVIICAVIFMIEYEVVKPMWRASRKDLIPTIATFVLCLGVGVELGIIIGVGINLVLLLYPSARPTVSVEKLSTTSGLEYILVTPGNSLYFPAVDFIKCSIGKAGLSSSHSPVLVDCRFILGADFTAAKGISALINEFTYRKQPLFFLHAKREVISIFEGIIGTDFQHIDCVDDMDQIVKETLNREQSRLLTGVENGHFAENSAALPETELQDISAENSKLQNNSSS